MAASEMTTESNPVEMLKSVLLSVIDNDGFTLPTQQSKLCLENACSLLESFCRRSPNSQTHSNWLVGQLNNVICKATRRGSYILNEEGCGVLIISGQFPTLFNRSGKDFFLQNNCPMNLCCTNISPTKH